MIETWDWILCGRLTVADFFDLFFILFFFWLSRYLSLEPFPVWLPRLFLVASKYALYRVENRFRSTEKMKE